jgi:hypothetical protein
MQETEEVGMVLTLLTDVWDRPVQIWTRLPIIVTKIFLDFGHMVTYVLHIMLLRIYCMVMFNRKITDVNKISMFLFFYWLFYDAVSVYNI